MKDKEDIANLDETQVYEVGYHILPTVLETDLRGEVSKIQSLISASEGSITSEAFPEMVGLAYEIAKKTETKQAKFNRTYFGWIKFEIGQGQLSKIDSELKANPNVLRYLIIKTVKENTLYIPKVISIRREEVAPESLVSSLEEKIVKTPASEEEIDKSIDELVIG